MNVNYTSVEKKKKKKYNVVLRFMIAVNDFVSNEILDYHTHVQLLAIQLSIPCYCNPPNGLQMLIGI